MACERMMQVLFRYAFRSPHLIEVYTRLAPDLLFTRRKLCRNHRHRHLDRWTKLVACRASLSVFFLNSHKYRRTMCEYVIYLDIPSMLYHDWAYNRLNACHSVKSSIVTIIISNLKVSYCIVYRSRENDCWTFLSAERYYVCNSMFSCTMYNCISKYVQLHKYKLFNHTATNIHGMFNIHSYLSIFNILDSRI